MNYWKCTWRIFHIFCVCFSYFFPLCFMYIFTGLQTNFKWYFQVHRHFILFNQTWLMHWNSSLHLGRTHSSFQKNSWRNTSSTTTNRNIPLSLVQLSCKNIGSGRDYLIGQKFVGQNCRYFGTVSKILSVEILSNMSM